MDSTDQVETQSQEEQPKVDNLVVEQLNDSVKDDTLIDLQDGSQVSLGELTKGYMRNDDYTRKTQDLSEKRKELDGEKTQLARSTAPSQEVQLDPEVQKAAEVLKEAGFVTKDDLALSVKKQSDDLKLQRLLDTNPDLASKEDAIRAIGKTDNRAWEDIIVDYGFKESNKIVKARESRGIKGVPTPKVEEAKKSMGQMTSDEYIAWKKENLSGQTF